MLVVSFKNECDPMWSSCMNSIMRVWKSNSLLILLAQVLISLVSIKAWLSCYNKLSLGNTGVGP